ncbi:MAG: SDR family NAD(P)-dependent oxidoreductase [Planctomycetota bacterium]
MSRPVSLITGAAGGIGHAVAEVLLARAERVVATDRDAPLLDAPETLLEARDLDVRDPAAWRAAIDAALSRWGRLDRLIHVAGVLVPGSFHEASLTELELHLDVNLKGALLGTRLACDVMRAAGRGHVIAVASLAALAPIPGLALYSASKAGLRAGLLAASDELRAFGVAVTVVSPDAVKTPMLDAQLDSDAAALTFSGPRRVLEPRDVAEAICGPEVLERRPLELWLPPSRGWLAKLADAAPRAGFALGSLLRRRGRALQAEMRRERD